MLHLTKAILLETKQNTNSVFFFPKKFNCKEKEVTGEEITDLKKT